ncbi:hypothetical protein Dsin_007432 [Dipteronia sinensis]|uniref:RNase H type-1 domain-containing protein n=1 Tax=Dipteronia sinensis TaxID=43782 RepID=A0AAE0B147_9ROSI|nr:hypothetical protein Dsin_007432 [Dipteronia sinensis]
MSSSVSYNHDLDAWFMVNLKDGEITVDNIPRWLQFVGALWFLWKWRCKTAFDNDFVSPCSPNLIINQYCRDWMDAIVNANVKTSIPVEIVWQPPSDGWVKLNVDGSRDPISGVITAGGVLRDHSKNWLRGFVINKGVGSILEAEMWGLLEGLSMLLKMDTNANHPLFSIAMSCIALINAEWCCSIIHEYREGNRVVDAMAKLGHKLEIGLHFFESPPPEVVNVLLKAIS